MGRILAALLALSAGAAQAEALRMGDGETYCYCAGPQCRAFCRNLLIDEAGVDRGAIGEPVAISGGFDRVVWLSAASFAVPPTTRDFEAVALLGAREEVAAGEAHLFTLDYGRTGHGGAVDPAIIRLYDPVGETMMDALIEKLDAAGK